MTITELERSNVRQVAAQLPLDEARALWLVDVCGMTYAAAASETRSTIEIVSAQVARGRTRLRKRLASHGTE